MATFFYRPFLFCGGNNKDNENEEGLEKNEWAKIGCKINCTTWQYSYKDIFPTQILQERTYDKNLARVTERWNKKKLNEKQNIIFSFDKPCEEISDIKKAQGFVNWGETRSPLKPFVSQSSLEVYSLYVLPQHQRKGLGEKLLIQFFNIAKQLKIKEVILSTHEKTFSNKFYLKTGGNLVGRIPGEFYKHQYFSNVYHWAL